MGALVAALMTGLRWLVGGTIGAWFARAMVWFGLSVGTTTVVLQPALDQLQSFAAGSGGAGEYWTIARQWAGVLNFDKALTMVVSAYVASRAVSAGRAFLFKRGG